MLQKTMKLFGQLFMLCGLLLLLSNCKAEEPQPKPQEPKVQPAATIVYVVRHAEKENAPGNPDPGLSAAGQERALALHQRLNNENVAALFSTPYKRTRLTLKPLADSLGLTVQDYAATNYVQLANKITQEYANKTVVVAGHSNTVLEIIEALGATKPVATVSESDYNYLFKVTLPAGETAKAEALHYGK